MTITYTNDVDAPVRVSNNIEYTSPGNNISTQVWAQAPACGPGSVSNMSVPKPFPVAMYTVTPPADPVVGAQPAEPPFF